MSTKILPHNNPTKQSQQNSQQQEQAAALVAEYNKLPDDLKQLYAPIAIAIFGKEAVSSDK